MREQHKLLIVFVLALALTVGVVQAYPYDEGSEDKDGIEYYDYRTGEWKTISEPDPWIRGGGCGGVGGSGAVMIMLFGILFLIFFMFRIFEMLK